MEQVKRTRGPAWLSRDWKELGRTWKTNREQGRKFNWSSREKYKDLITILSKMTNGHCSFCDAAPIGPRLDGTIEHFRPKSRFPLLAYQWRNLFLCCHLCQKSKLDKFEETLLKPDVSVYRYEHFFQFNWSNGKLEPRARLSAKDTARAQCTIELYGLNNNGKPQDRRREAEKFKNNTAQDIQELSYRFALRTLIEPETTKED